MDYIGMHQHSELGKNVAFLGFVGTCTCIKSKIGQTNQNFYKVQK